MTVIAWSNMVPRTLQAIVDLVAQNISVEVVDPRAFVPVDRGMNPGSVAKARRAVFLQEAMFH